MCIRDRVSFIYPENFKLIGSKLQPLALKTIKHAFSERVSEASLHFQGKRWLLCYPLRNIVRYCVCVDGADERTLASSHSKEYEYIHRSRGIKVQTEAGDRWKTEESATKNVFLNFNNELEMISS